MEKNSEKITKQKNEIFIFTLFFLILAFSVWYAIDFSTEQTNLLIKSRPGTEYTPEKWWDAEVQYCSQKNMTAVQKVVGSGGILGPTTKEITICAKDNKETKIDYDNPLFCKYTAAGDLNRC